MTRLVPKYKRLGTKTVMKICSSSVPVHVLCTLNKVGKKLSSFGRIGFDWSDGYVFQFGGQA